MSRNSRALKKARTSLSQPGLPLCKAKGPGDVAVMIPYLLGFQPEESLVVVALEGPRKRFGPVCRIDLVGDPTIVPLQAAQLLGVVRTNGASQVLLAAFTDDPAHAEALMCLVRAELAAHDVAVVEAFRADGSRWWSYLCHDPLCCSPDGVPYDAGTAQIAAEAVVAGMSFAPDRDALRDRFQPVDAGRLGEVGREVDRLRRLDAAAIPLSAAAGLAARVESWLGDEADLPATEVAWLGLAVQSQQGQDTAFSLVRRATAAQHFELWRSVMCQVGDDLLPRVGCITAFAAWLDGTGVLASHAIDRVFEVAPNHSLARQLEALLINSVNPRTWEQQWPISGEDSAEPPVAD